jgi:hypothetical protein
MFVIGLIIGYILAVLFPIPGLSSGITNLWLKLFASIGATTTPTTTATPTTPPTPTTMVPTPIAPSSQRGSF